MSREQPEGWLIYDLIEADLLRHRTSKEGPPSITLKERSTQLGKPRPFCPYFLPFLFSGASANAKSCPHPLFHEGLGDDGGDSGGGGLVID